MSTHSCSGWYSALVGETTKFPWFTVLYKKHSLMNKFNHVILQVDQNFLYQGNEQRCPTLFLNPLFTVMCMQWNNLHYACHLHTIICRHKNEHKQLFDTVWVMKWKFHSPSLLLWIFDPISGCCIPALVLFGKK